MEGEKMNKFWEGSAVHREQQRHAAITAFIETIISNATPIDSEEGSDSGLHRLPSVAGDHTTTADSQIFSVLLRVRLRGHLCDGPSYAAFRASTTPLRRRATHGSSEVPGQALGQKRYPYRRQRAGCAPA